MPYDPKQHGPRRIVGPGFHKQVYEVVCRIPSGFVSTYGDVAAAIGLRAAARQVGFALSAIPNDREDVPWHRVVNSVGKLSDRSHGEQPSRQQQRLESEGVPISKNGRVGNFEDRRFVF